MDNTQFDTVSSTAAVVDSGKTESACSRKIVYKERSVHAIDIVYTDIFLDVTNYYRDKRLFLERILKFENLNRVGTIEDETDLESGDESEISESVRTNCAIVCSTALYNYISGAERASGKDPSRGPIARFENIDIFVCEATMEIAPERVDSLVTFNIDPFELCARVGNRDQCAEFRRTFKGFISGDAPPLSSDGSPAVRLVFNTFLLNERAFETYMAVNNVGIEPSDVRLVFVHDNSDAEVVREIVCNYCTDLMLCLNSDMQSFVVDGEMPSSVDFALASNPLYLVVLKTRLDVLRASPEHEYFRFKQFYHTFAYGKQSKWCIQVDGGHDPAGDLSNYIHSLNEALQIELARLFKFLRRVARRKFESELKPSLTHTLIGSANEDYEESEQFIEAREKLLKAYYSCPILMNTVDLRSITMLGNDQGRTLLKRDQQRLLASLRKGDGDKDGTNDRGGGDVGQYSLESQTRIYDTMTYPLGGDVSDTNVLDVLFAEEIAASGCFVVGQNYHVKYNRFILNLLFPQS